MKYKSLLIVVGFILALVVICSNCVNTQKVQPDLRGEKYAGASTCVQCHKNISDSFTHNAHFKTSQTVNTDSLQKLVITDSSFFFNEHTKIVIEKRDSGYYQVAYADGKAIEAHRFSIAFGSGEKAQTFAFWQGNRLYQQPLTYFSSIGKWANSPGFPPDKALFTRAIISRCFECHGSFAKANFVQTGPLSTAEEIEPQSIMYGIDCERCHGPAADHVNFHSKNPEEKKAHFITVEKSLTRQMKLDRCGICHSGNDSESIKPTFSFKPGDKLTDFYSLYFGGSKPGTVDVHGKQNQMLAASKCFIKSNMDCETCHSVHVPNMQVQAYSQKCLSCHSAAHQTDTKIPKSAAVSNCINCHMPVQPSKVITYQLAGKTKVEPYLLITHKIAVYPAETQKVLEFFKQAALTNSSRLP